MRHTFLALSIFCFLALTSCDVDKSREPDDWHWGDHPEQTEEADAGTSDSSGGSKGPDVPRGDEDKGSKKPYPEQTEEVDVGISDNGTKDPTPSRPSSGSSVPSTTYKPSKGKQSHWVKVSDNELRNIYLQTILYKDDGVTRTWSEARAYCKGLGRGYDVVDMAVADTVIWEDEFNHSYYKGDEINNFDSAHDKSEYERARSDLNIVRYTDYKDSLPGLEGDNLTYWVKGLGNKSIPEGNSMAIVGTKNKFTTKKIFKYRTLCAKEA